MIDPLKFQVAIQDEATKKLKEIEQEFNSLKDKTISVRVDGIEDLRTLLSSLQHTQMEKFGKEVASGIQDAAKGLQEEAQKAVRTSLGELAKDLAAVKLAIQNDNFTAFSGRIATCAEKVASLTEAFNAFKTVIGENEELKNLLTGWGAAIREVSSAIAAMNATKGAMSAKGKSDNEEIRKQEEGLIKVANALGRIRSAVGGGGGTDTGVPFMESITRVGERNIQTLIKEQGHIERLIAIARKSIDFGEGHPVLGMGRLRGDQMRNLQDLEAVKKTINEILFAASRGEQSAIRFLNTLGSLRTTPLGKDLMGNDITLLGGHFDNLTHSVTNTSQAMRQLGKDMRLDLVKGSLEPSINDETWAKMKQQAAAHQAASEAAKEHKRRAEELTSAFAQYDSQVTKSQRVQEGDNKARQESVSALRQQAQALVKARMEMLQSQSGELRRLLANGKEKLGAEQYEAVRNALRGIREEMLQIETVMQRMGSYSTRSLFSLGRGGMDYSPLISSVGKNVEVKEQAARAAAQLTSEEQRLAHAMTQTTQSAHGQSQILSDLKSMAMQYLGVWGGQQFLHNIIEIGGQLEMQRLSIGAILQDTAHANELFDRIKGLATQSPFGVVQLDQMTKQLTAYGFKYNELYDMTKRLADISAATGTDVSRLALALGHVRSEAALSGYTLRQFSMANVPLLQKLSEKLGKTTKEIRDMVRKKDIGYEDVVGVLKDLTNEGGMFYNMQEVISESVKAKFKNVKDAMNIMYGEMAEGTPGDALKEVANVLMELTRNWKDVATVMGSVAGTWAIHRAAVLLMNAALGGNTAAVSANILSYKQKRAVELQNEALTRKLTAEELALVNTRKQITAANMRVALSTNAITKGEALRLVGLRKLSLEEAKTLIRSGEFTAAEVRMAMQGRVLGMNLGYAGNMMRYFGLQLKTAMVAMFTNPLTWVMAGITAVMELWQRNSRELEAAKELSEKIYNRSQEALKNTRQMMSETGIKVEWRRDDSEDYSDVTGNFGGKIGGSTRFILPEFDESEAEESIERWAQYIRDYAATPNRILNEALFDTADNVRSLKEQFDNLKKSVMDVASAQDVLQGIGEVFENAVNATNGGPFGGLFDENLLTNIADYDKELKNFDKEITKVYRLLPMRIDSAIKFARHYSRAFDEAVSGMATSAQQFAYLVKNHESLPVATDVFEKVSPYTLSSLTGSKLVGTGYGDVQNKRATMMEDLGTFYTQFEGDLEMKGITKKKIQESEAVQQALLLGYKDKLSSIQGLSEETANELMKLFAQHFGIELDADDEKFKVKVSEAIRLLRGLSDSEWNVTMNFATTINDVIEEARKQYKAAKDYYENAKPIMLKFGIQAEMGKEFTDEEIDKMVNQSIPSDLNTPEAQAQRDLLRQTLKAWSEASRLYNQATKASENGGFTLEEEKKEKKGSSAYKDEFAKRWDERIRIMKEAYDWYDKWEKKVGNDAAINEVNAKYADIFAEWGEDKKLPMTFEGKDIKEYAKYVEQIRDDALNRYKEQTSTEANRKKYNGGQEALRVYRQAVSLLNDVKFDNFGKAAEQFKSIIDQTIEDLNERWDIFDAVRDATGNVQTAGRIAGFGAAETGARNSADAMRNELRRLMRDAGGDYLLSQMMPFDARLDEESLRTKFENAIPNTGDAERYKEKIDGLIKAYQEWQKLQQKVEKDDATVYAKLIGSVVSYDAQIGKLQDKLTQQKESNKALVAAGTISQSDADRADEMAQAQFNWEKMKLSADYANIYNNAVAMSRTEFDNAAKAIENMLDKLHELGLISPEDYISERGKLDKARTEWSTTGFLGEKGAVGSFISGGYDGLMNYYAGRKNTALQKAEKSTDPAKKKNLEQEADHYGKLFDRLSKLSDAAKDVITAFSTLQSGLDLVGGMFDSLGMEGAANAAGDAAGILGSGLSGAQSLSSLGPWGMAAGAALGLVSGIAQTHDKALERQIGKLREDVQQIEANTKLIQQARERTLGFDTGDLRQIYSQQYKPDSELLASFGKSAFLTQFLRAGFLSRAQKDMYEYYTKNSSGTGYQQEYQNLLAQRKDYLDILEKQESKKKKSQSDIEETKSKIAELDDQIRYFTDDLAKELFDIDIKGWADELSDALASAFENGEDMAKAYRDTVTSILQQVASKMMKMSIIEPMFQTLQDRLFGNTEKKISGVFNPNDPQGSLGKVTSMITDFFGKGGEGEKTITAATEFMAAFQRGVQNAGLTVLNESSNTLSSGIQGTSEETSDLLASYVNALRQDVSANRILATQFVSEMWPSYIEQVSSIVNATNRIDGNVAAIRALLSENGTLYVLIDSMKSHFDNITNGNERVTVQ